MRQLIIILTLIFTLQACDDSSAPYVPSEQEQAAAQETYGGKVAETIEVDSYVYLRIESEKGPAWIATGRVQVYEGDVITFPGGVVMENFRSAALGRTFEMITFVDSIEITEPAGGRALPPPSDSTLPEGHPDITSPAQADPALSTPVEPAEGGLSIGEIHAQYPSIADQPVTVRGRVLKFSPAIMGANWITLSDGAGSEPANLLVVKTLETAGIGEIVSVTGTVRVDVSLGYGYDYKILLEDDSLAR